MGCAAVVLGGLSGFLVGCDAVVLGGWVVGFGGVFWVCGSGFELVWLRFGFSCWDSWVCCLMGVWVM